MATSTGLGYEAHVFYVSLFYRRLVAWTLCWLGLLITILYLSSFFGTGRFRFDFINAVGVFCSMLLVNAVWFFDIRVSANTDVWLRERGKRLFVSVLTFLSCASSTFMVSLLFQGTIEDPAGALSSMDLLMCSVFSTAALLYRYDSGWWREAIIKYPWILSQDGSAYKKTDGDTTEVGDNASIPVKMLKALSSLVGKEFISSMRWSIIIVGGTIAWVFAGKYLYSGSICNLNLEFVKNIAFCQERRAVTVSHRLVTYFWQSYNVFWMAILIQLLPLTMFTTLKMLIFSPVSFISAPSYKGGAVESTSSLRRSQSNVAPETVRPATSTLTKAMCFGQNSIRSAIRFSWESATDTMSALSPVSTPRWQEACYVYKDINKQLVNSLKVSFLGPPAVPYLHNGGGGGLLVDASGGRLHTIMRSLAMEDFALVASAQTRGLVQCRKQLFLSGWGDAVSAALTFVSAVTLQVQLITCHAMEEVLAQQQRHREVRSSASSARGSTGARDVRNGPGRGQQRDSEDIFKFNQIMGGHLQVKNLDRVYSIPDAVVALVRRGKDRMDRSLMGYFGNKMLFSWSWSGWMRPLLRAVYARYPFAHAVPPLVLQTCLNAVKGISAGLQNALTDDATGTAEYHLIAAVELLIKLELTMEEYEVCMKRCHVNVLTDMRRVYTLDMRTLQIETASSIDSLVGAYRDVLSRSDCPLLQDQCVAPVLLQRIKSMR